jgi:hypothetical protein
MSSCAEQLPENVTRQTKSMIRRAPLMAQVGCQGAHLGIERLPDTDRTASRTLIEQGRTPRFTAGGRNLSRRLRDAVSFQKPVAPATAMIPAAPLFGIRQANVRLTFCERIPLDL